MKYIYITLVLVSGMVLFNSCAKDLDTVPRYGLNSATVYDDVNNYINVLAKIYGGLTLTGNEGPAGNPDIQDIDEGFSSYIRVLWNLQELPTDESVCGWNDTGIPELNTMGWGSSNSFVKAMYSRLYFQIALCNEFIRESTDENIDRRGFNDSDKQTIQTYHAEARLLRALSWIHAIDLFGNVPFITEDDGIGSITPEQISRSDLFAYVEGELKELEAGLMDARTNEYARADKAAAWFLLAKLYLNAEVYTGTARYADCAEYCAKIINAGYQLHPTYQGMFLADNHLSEEMIFPIASDGMFTQSWGGMTFMTHAFVGGTMNSEDFGINGGWAGYRSTKAFSDLFVADTTEDSRFLFHRDGQQQLIEEIGQFSNGWAVGKYKNVTSAGEAGSDPTGDHVDTDFPLMRLAEVFLMYAECAANGAADENMAIGYINQLRERAYGNSSANITSFDLDFILTERGKELQWEAKRRTDLIRHKKFTGGDLLWEFKGGEPTGKSVSDHLNLYPLSADDVIANPNLTQNPGY